MRARFAAAFLLAATTAMAGLGIHQASASTHSGGSSANMDDFVPYDQPTPEYKQGSCRFKLERYPLGQGPPVTAPCNNILNFKTSEQIIHERVPFTGWESWGSKPLVEKAQPDIITVDPYAQLDVRFRRTTEIGGLEIEPKDGATATFTATFYSSEDVPGCLGSVVGSITRTVQGNGGALLFGANYQPGFRCIRITSSDGAAYAIAEIRIGPHHHHHGAPTG